MLVKLPPPCTEPAHCLGRVPIVKVVLQAVAAAELQIGTDGAEIVPFCLQFRAADRIGELPAPGIEFDAGDILMKVNPQATEIIVDLPGPLHIG